MVAAVAVAAVARTGLVDSKATDRNGFWLVFSVSAAIRFVTDATGLQRRGAIEAPSFVINRDNILAADLRLDSL